VNPIEVEAYAPGIPDSLTLDEYVDLMTMVAACGIADQADLLPDYLYYDNPKTGYKCSIGRPPTNPGD
jgi:hypothetical protein